MKHIMDLKKCYLLEDLFPKSFADYEERSYGILFYNITNKDSYDSNHAVIFRNKINSLSETLNDIISFYHENNVSEADNERERQEAQSQIEKLEVRGTYYWIYSPGEKACMFDEFYDQGIMGIGWDEIGDISNLSREQIADKLHEHYDDKSYSNISLCLYQFVNDMKDGDIWNRIYTYYV